MKNGYDSVCAIRRCRRVLNWWTIVSATTDGMDLMLVEVIMSQVISAMWSRPDTKVLEELRVLSQQCLDSYRIRPSYVVEHANIERATAQGGYGRRQLYELIQNGADALLGYTGGRIEIVLSETALYCANEGAPIDADGVSAILSSHISMKRGTEIGRFGLGFKSVLGVSNNPQFFSRSGSFGFDSGKSAAAIREIVPDVDRTPILRLAWELDPAQAAAIDSTLAELMEWATTVVKLPRSRDQSEWLSEDLVDFPAEFLLFSPHIDEVTLQDHTTLRSRRIAMARDDRVLLLSDGNEISLWRVFRADYKPSNTAANDAGELAGRDSLPIVWAVPLEGRATRGRFWAFFPTEYVTTLSGILNAPWKTNEDRQNLLKGTFNSEMIDRAAQLVVDSLPELVMDADNDPAWYLDLLPGRGREAPQWADKELTDRIYTTAARQPSLPDQTGRLRAPMSLRLHPPGLDRSLVEQWSGHPSRPTGWCHPSVETRERRPRVERLLEPRIATPIQEWLEVLVREGDVRASAAALNLAAAIVVRFPDRRDDVTAARIVISLEGKLFPPQTGVIFLPATEGSLAPEGLVVVHPELAASDETRADLERLGISEVDPSSELENLIRTRNLPLLDPAGWSHFWSLTRGIPEQSLALLTESDAILTKLKVKTKADTYRLLSECLLPGPIVPADGSRDAGITIDTDFHDIDLPLLHKLGAIDGPRPAGISRKETYFLRYFSEVAEGYRRQLASRSPSIRSAPKSQLLEFDDIDCCAGPIGPLFYLSDEGKTAYTAALLEYAVGDSNWRLSHRTQVKYPTLSFRPPSLWAIRKVGLLQTSQGPRSPAECLGPSLGTWATIFPVTDCSPESAGKLEIPDSLDDVPPERWKEALERTLTLRDDSIIGSFYACACRYVGVPSRVACRVGERIEDRVPDFGQGVVVVSGDQSPVGLLHFNTPYISVETSEQAELLIHNWGLRAAPQTDLTVQAEPSGPEVPLLDVFSALDLYIDPAHETVTLVPCRFLRVEILTYDGKLSEDQDFWLETDEDRLLVTDRLKGADLLDAVIAALKITLLPNERDHVLNHRVSVEKTNRLAEVRRQPTLAEKLLTAVGSEMIRKRLPNGLLTAAEELFGHLTEAEVAELALSVYGVDTLREFRRELDQAGLEPPREWSGSRAARRFVKSLGFPSEYAGFLSTRRERILEIDGPPELHPMHSFQREIASEIRVLLRSSGERRGLLSLPTGAGKTRVTVQALIESIKEDGFKGPILWIAQSDELCEQAIQSWSYVWRTLGPRSTLRLSRLWAANEADPWDEGPHVVIATIQKLQGCVGDSDYEWLSHAECVVVDEAHQATTPSYTNVLDWLGLSLLHRQFRCPLIGLTATPFRGGEQETRRLISRFGGVRLDRDVLGNEPYSHLQEMGVLAYVEHKLLEGSEISLSEAERAHLDRLRVLPTAAGDRLGRNISRNTELLNSILGHPEDWTILLFATSVNHAQTMAALLNREGVSAAAVSADTDSNTRRHYIDEFRAGRLRVLTNFAVLTAGFDAPAVRAIYVARPTFSDVLYQQMIGRGLRGPMNGGKERCLIVNVRDNIALHGYELSFTKFEYLWRGSRGTH